MMLMMQNMMSAMMTDPSMKEMMVSQMATILKESSQKSSGNLLPTMMQQEKDLGSHFAKNQSKPVELNVLGSQADNRTPSIASESRVQLVAVPEPKPVIQDAKKQRITKMIDDMFLEETENLDDFYNRYARTPDIHPADVKSAINPPPSRTFRKDPAHTPEHLETDHHNYYSARNRYSDRPTHRSPNAHYYQEDAYDPDKPSLLLDGESEFVPIRKSHDSYMEQQRKLMSPHNFYSPHHNTDEYYEGRRERQQQRVSRDPSFEYDPRYHSNEHHPARSRRDEDADIDRSTGYLDEGKDHQRRETGRRRVQDNLLKEDLHLTVLEDRPIGTRGMNRRNPPLLEDDGPLDSNKSTLRDVYPDDRPIGGTHRQTFSHIDDDRPIKPSNRDNHDRHLYEQLSDERPIRGKTTDDRPIRTAANPDDLPIRGVSIDDRPIKAVSFDDQPVGGNRPANKRRFEEEEHLPKPAPAKKQTRKNSTPESNDNNRSRSPQNQTDDNEDNYEVNNFEDGPINEHEKKLIKNTGKTFEQLLEEQLAMEAGDPLPKQTHSQADNSQEESAAASQPNKKHSFLKKNSRPVIPKPKQKKHKTEDEGADEPKEDQDTNQSQKIEMKPHVAKKTKAPTQNRRPKDDESIDHKEEDDQASHKHKHASDKKEKQDDFDLEVEKKKIKDEKERLRLKEKKLQDDIKHLNKEKEDFAHFLKEENDKLDLIKKEEIEKIRKEKKVADRNQKLTTSQVSKKEKEELESLKDKVNKLTEELKEKDKKNKFTIERQKKQIEELLHSNKELEEQLHLLEQNQQTKSVKLEEKNKSNKKSPTVTSKKEVEKLTKPSQDQKKSPLKKTTPTAAPAFDQSDNEGIDEFERHENAAGGDFWEENDSKSKEELEGSSKAKMNINPDEYAFSANVYYQEYLANKKNSSSSSSPRKAAQDRQPVSRKRQDADHLRRRQEASGLQERRGARDLPQRLHHRALLHRRHQANPPRQLHHLLLRRCRHHADHSPRQRPQHLPLQQQPGRVPLRRRLEGNQVASAHQIRRRHREVHLHQRRRRDGLQQRHDPAHRQRQGQDHRVHQWLEGTQGSPQDTVYPDGRRVRSLADGRIKEIDD